MIGHQMDISGKVPESGRDFIRRACIVENPEGIEGRRIYPSEKELLEASVCFSFKMKTHALERVSSTDSYGFVYRKTQAIGLPYPAHEQLLPDACSLNQYVTETLHYRWNPLQWRNGPGSGPVAMNFTILMSTRSVALDSVFTKTGLSRAEIVPSSTTTILNIFFPVISPVYLLPMVISGTISGFKDKPVLQTLSSATRSVDIRMEFMAAGLPELGHSLHCE